MSDPQQQDPQQSGASHRGSRQRTPIESRYPQFSEFDAMDDDQRIETLSRTLDALQHELNDQRQS